MKKKIFAVYDDKAQTYNSPLFLNTDGEALRALSDEVNNPESLIHKHPDDFRLYRLGSYDSDTGAITPEDPVRLGVASEYLRKQ